MKVARLTTAYLAEVGNIEAQETDSIESNLAYIKRR